MFRSAVFCLCFVLFLGCSGIHTKQLELAEPLEETRAAQERVSEIRVGEKLTYSVRWLGMEVGAAVAEVTGIETINGREAYHVAAHARSNSLIDIVYPVRDEHHSYIDRERLHSLRYEKILQEGRYRADEVIEFDQENHSALYYSRKNGSKKKMLIQKDVLDELSSAFWFRLQPMSVGDEVHIPAMADEKNWDLVVRVLQRDRVHIKELGSFDAFRLEPSARFRGMFVRRGKITGWLSTDEKRLPLMMKTKIPVLGTITVVLKDYQSGALS